MRLKKNKRLRMENILIILMEKAKFYSSNKRDGEYKMKENEMER